MYQTIAELVTAATTQQRRLSDVMIAQEMAATNQTEGGGW